MDETLFFHKCCCREYPYPTHRRFLGFRCPPPLPLVKLHTFSYFPVKNVTFEMPFPLGIFDILQLGGNGFFLEPHIVANIYM